MHRKSHATFTAIGTRRMEKIPDTVRTKSSSPPNRPRSGSARDYARQIHRADQPSRISSISSKSRRTRQPLWFRSSGTEQISYRRFCSFKSPPNRHRTEDAAWGIFASPSSTPHPLRLRRRVGLFPLSTTEHPVCYQQGARELQPCRFLHRAHLPSPLVRS